MSGNPLQKYFRQPKLFVGLPSRGLFSKSGTLEGNLEQMPIFGMTGMDEIMMKTPDALFNGETTVKIIESCCPNIKNAWEVCSLDLDLLLIAIRVATYGQNMGITHTCKNCTAVNDFEVDLTKMIEHYGGKTYDNKVIMGDLTVHISPLSYKRMTEYNLENFKLQKKLSSLYDIEDQNRQQEEITKLYQELALLQTQIFIDGVDSVETPDGVVDQKEFIKEWLKNSEKSMFEYIKQKIEENRKQWTLPTLPVDCPECGTHAELEVQMDQSNFFGKG